MGGLATHLDVVTPPAEADFDVISISDEGAMSQMLMSTPRRTDKRQQPRTRVAWPVLIKLGTDRYLSMSVDVSTHGTKVRTNARLQTGTAVQLELVPPEGPPIRVGALVWRIDTDGLALIFSRNIQHRLIRVV